MLAELFLDVDKQQQQLAAAVRILRNAVSPDDRRNALTWVEKFQIKDEKVMKAVQVLAEHDPDTSVKSQAQGILESHNVGGINLNPTAMDLEIDQSGSTGAKVTLDLQKLEKTLKNNPIAGLSPVIIQMIPVNNLPFLLGLESKRDAAQQVSRL